jgi:hypothetical protein
MEPIYTAENPTAAYQLNGSLALFGKTKIPDQEPWLNELKTAIELDGASILPSKTRSDTTVQFLVSTCPRSSPAHVVRSVKGRFQYLIQKLIPKAIRRNYHVHFYAGIFGGYDRGVVRIRAT